MGCDIYMHVEYKDRNGKWACGDYFSLHPNSTLEDPQYDVQDFCGDRNYGLFSILADVRNYDNVEPIDRPRRLPEDISEFTKRFYKDWEMDAHSCSYFTLRELIDFYETNYNYDMDCGALKDLIEELKKRADEFNIIWSFMWESNYDKAYSLSDKIRIVFWFDN